MGAQEGLVARFAGIARVHQDEPVQGTQDQAGA
jgi:hypothetical protein